MKNIKHHIVVQANDGKDVVAITKVIYGIHAKEENTYDFPKFDSETLFELDYILRGRKRGRMKEGIDIKVQTKSKMSVEANMKERWF